MGTKNKSNQFHPPFSLQVTTSQQHVCHFALPFFITPLFLSYSQSQKKLLKLGIKFPIGHTTMITYLLYRILNNSGNLKKPHD
jgi:hypothetical protein